MNIQLKSSFFRLQIIFLILFSFSCQPKVESESDNYTESVRYLALGDSYTIGTGINPENNWPNQLVDSLATRGFSVDTSHIIAKNGWTTTDLKSGISTQQPETNYTLVSLLIGVNNQYQGLELKQYRTEFRELLEQAIGFAGNERGNVFVVSIPNYGITPFAKSLNPIIIRQEIDVYNDIAKEISAEYQIPFINITDISEMAANDATLLAVDNLHPSEKMYRRWIEEMLPTVSQIIQE